MRVFSEKKEMNFCWGIIKRWVRIRQKIVCLWLPVLETTWRRKLLASSMIKKDFRNSLVKMIGDFNVFSAYAGETERGRITAAANEIIAGYYDILGSGKTQLKPIDWHTDFKSGFTWPKGEFYLKYVQVDYSNNADVKVPRELSRSHHLLILGQAYLLTRDEKYALEFKEQIESWIDENPFQYSINWGCAMDVAIRVVNWIYALHMFIDSQMVDDKFIKRMRHSLYEHGHFIFNNLERSYNNNNNHYFSNLAGLLYLGLLFHGIPDGKRWFAYSQAEFYREIRYQFLPSGISYEKSVSYNRLMVELAVYPYLLLVNNNINVPLDIRYRLNTLFDFILYYIKPSGEAPVIGDQDNGRFLPFGIHAILDHRYLLTIGAILRKDPHLKKYADIELTDAFFLMGNTCRDKFAAIPECNEELNSKVFDDAGFCILRANDEYMFITNSGAAAYPDQTSAWGSHAHPDLLSFELAIGGITFLVDPGTYVYTAAPIERNLFRSTKMHNTVVVDDKNQHLLLDNEIFRCYEIAEPLDFTFEQTTEKDIFTGSHNGYARLENPVTHLRKVAFNKQKHSWEIEDHLTGKGKHGFKWYFHFDKGIDLLIEKNKVFTQSLRKTDLELMFTADFKIRLTKLNDFVSKSYGLKEPSYTLEVSANEFCPIILKTRVTRI